MAMHWIKKIFYAFTVGAILLSPLGWLQVRFQYVEYQNPVFLKMAWWVPLAYGLVFVAMVILFPPLEEVLTATFTFKHRYVFLEFIPICFAFLGPAFTQEYPYLMVLILAIYVLCRLGFFHAKWDWLFFLIGALLGPTIEILLISANLYHFSSPDFMGTPYALPLIWGIVTMSGRRIVNVLEGFAAKSG
jgi:hypothetical protein